MRRHHYNPSGSSRMASASSVRSVGSSRSMATRGSASKKVLGHTNGHSSKHNRNNGSVSVIVSEENCISTFVATIAKLPGEEWKAKTVALENLVRDLKDRAAAAINGDAQSVSSGRAGTGRSIPSSPNTITTASVIHPTSLRNLALPFRSLLSDLRTLVVKATCEALSQLSIALGERLRLLLVDLLAGSHTAQAGGLLQCHSQTVKVMHGYARAAVTDCLMHCPSARAVQHLCQQAKVHRSTEVRAICCYYLEVCLKHWRPSYLEHANTVPSSSSSIIASGGGGSGGGGSGMDLPMVIGIQLVHSIRDPSQKVRNAAREAFMDSYRRAYPRRFDAILHDRDGPLSKDHRLTKSLRAQAAEEASHFQEHEDESNDDRPTRTTLTLQQRPLSSSSVNANGVLGRISSSGLSLPSRVGLPESLHLNLASPMRRSLNNERSFSPRHPRENNSTSRHPRRRGDTGTKATLLLDDGSPPQKRQSQTLESAMSPLSEPSSPNTRTVIVSSISEEEQFPLSQTNHNLTSKKIHPHHAARTLQAVARGVLVRKGFYYQQQQKHQEHLLLQQNENKGVINLVGNNVVEEDLTTLDSHSLTQNSYTNNSYGQANSYANNTRTTVDSKEIIMLREAQAALARLRRSPGTHQQHSTDIPRHIVGRPSPVSSTRNLMGVAEDDDLGQPYVAPEPDELFPSTATNKIGRESLLHSPQRLAPLLIEQNNGQSTHPRRKSYLRQSTLLLHQRLHHQQRQQQALSQSEPSQPSTTATTIDMNLQTGDGNKVGKCEGDSSELEHFFIGRQLLLSHKHHVDVLMEILTEEMDVINQCEQHIDGMNLTEEDLLGYFEGTADCIDRRMEAGERLRIDIERILQG